ncbi:MAG: acetylglutamate kinase [Desulfobacterota bacterium]|nr:acetylglutamate kinase [Thermodesulfobacteriota bacterium]MDW8001357.1 acetylglutamate kinase [Deltaproteobacteria bacterium]
MKEKIAVLLEALPYIVKFHGKTFVIKYGGAAMEEEALRKEFARDIVLLNHVGIKTVIVHGGGKKITKFLEELKISSSFIDGLRVTDKQTLEIVEMVLSGSINKEIVKYINEMGGRAIGLSGKDGRLLLAKRVEDERLGFVGEVISVNAEMIESLNEMGYIPVIAPLADGLDGHTYNVNADTAAGSIAATLKAEKLILLTDVDGIMDASGNLISALNVEEIDTLIEKGIVKGGMVPKLECAKEALRKGTCKVHIINGNVPHALLLEIFTDSGIGTQISGE